MKFLSPQLIIDTMQNKKYTQNRFNYLDNHYSSLGIWIHWFNDVQSEVNYLQKTEPLNSNNLQKFRRSKHTILKNMPSHWSNDNKNKLKYFANESSDSESDDELYGDNYTSPASWTLLQRDGGKMDLMCDYRYIDTVRQNFKPPKPPLLGPSAIAFITLKQNDDIIPGFMQSVGKTAYTEFLDSRKKTQSYVNIEHFNSKVRFFSMPEEHLAGAKWYVDKFQGILSRHSQDVVYSLITKFEPPYNEGLFRFRAEEIYAIVLNNYQDSSCILNAIKIFFEIIKIRTQFGIETDHETLPIFVVKPEKQSDVHDITQTVIHSKQFQQELNSYNKWYQTQLTNFNNNKSSRHHSTPLFDSKDDLDNLDDIANAFLTHRHGKFT